MSIILQEAFGRWCVWRFGAPRVGSAKPSKTPVNPNTGALARANDPATFGTFAEAQRASAEYEGMGLLMSSGNGVICVDVDDCLRSDSTPNSTAAWALDNFKGYCEVSQSGNGLHFFMRAIKPEHCRTKLTRDGCSLEIYTANDTRFICVTGKPYRESCGDIIDEQAALNRFIDRFGFVRQETANNNTGSVRLGDVDDEQRSDEEIIKLLRQNNKRGKITRLMAGDTGDYENDHSAADLALASEIAFYTQDLEQAVRIFSTTALANRDKWRDRADYRKSTIQRAVESCKNYYWDCTSHDKTRAKATTEYTEKLMGGIEGLQLSKSGRPLSTIDNALQILLRDHRTQGMMGFNLFSGAPEVLRPLQEVFGPATSNTIGEFYEHDITSIRAWFNREWGITLPKGDAWDITLDWARHCKFNPVIARLDDYARLWDGVMRLDTWLRDYLGVETGNSPEYTQAISRKWLIGAVARAKQPGCKMDSVLVLEGPQGAGKSKVARLLAEAVYPAGFIENIPVLGNNQETVRALRGKFIAELAELSSIQGRVETEQVKAFLTTQEDNIREPYARCHKIWKRTVTFIGTTNEMEYLRDTTGGRRFWSVKVGSIDIDALRQIVPQLWGEAVRAYDRGDSWHLEGQQALAQAAEQQHARQLSDCWDDGVFEFVHKAVIEENVCSRRWSLSELFSLVFPRQETLDVRPQTEQKRFAGVLRRCGFGSLKTRGLNRWFITPSMVSKVRES